MSVLSQVDTWPVTNAAAAVIDARGIRDCHGDPRRVYRLASLAKVLTSWAILVAVEDGSIGLDSPVGQPGCTLRHLLSHAGGYAFDGPDPITRPGRRRIYSNTGIEIAVEAVVAATDIPFDEYLCEAVFEPLGMTNSSLRGSPAHAIWSDVDDLSAFVSEMFSPTLLLPSTVAEATSVQFPDLGGRVPGIGNFSPCPWGLGVEIHGAKQRHWMGTTNSPATFGHFGGAGTMMWLDPVAGVGLVALTDRSFDEWAETARRVWPALSDAVVAAAAERG